MIEFAIPHPIKDENFNDIQQGLTIRDYFAAKAMQGLLDAGYENKDVAKRAYIVADQMMEARKNG